MKLVENKIYDFRGKPVLVKKLLGEGAQGLVYLVNYNGKDYALKLYKEKPSDKFIENLLKNISKQSPCESFLWPLEVISIDDNYGYIMDLRPSRFIEFSRYLNGKKFLDTRTMLEWCISLCYAFKKLHEKGLSYQDLNLGSLFLDQTTGELLICDNDNVCPNGFNISGIKGMMRFMAPEIVRDDKMPDVHSDRFSLAIILFYTLAMGDPFEGKRLENYPIADYKYEMLTYGTNPVYIYNCNDNCNRPIPGYHVAVLKRFPTLPKYIKDAFHRTFVDGLKDRENGRTTEIEWINLIKQYYNEILTCPTCNYQFHYGFFDQKVSVCPNCKSPIYKFFVLKIDKIIVALEPGKKIFLTDIDKYSSEHTKVAGVVIRNKANPNVWGIKLDLPNNVVITSESGATKEISGTGVFPIINNLTIKFNSSITGKIVLGSNI